MILQVDIRFIDSLHAEMLRSKAGSVINLLNCKSGNSKSNNIVNAIIKITTHPHGVMTNQGSGNKYITSHALLEMPHRAADIHMFALCKPL